MVVIENARQRDALVRALRGAGGFITVGASGCSLDIVAIELNEALEAMGSLTVRSTSLMCFERISVALCRKNSMDYDAIVIGAGHAGIEAALALPGWAGGR